MRKFFAIPLLILYLTAVSGMMVQLHFCGDKLASWNLNAPKNSCCCETPADEPVATLKEKSNSCCVDQVITLKIDQEQDRATGIFLSFSNYWAVVSLRYGFLPNYTFYTDKRTENVYYAQAPPGLWQNIPLYKLHSRFTYYG